MLYFILKDSLGFGSGLTLVTSWHNDKDPPQSRTHWSCRQVGCQSSCSTWSYLFFWLPLRRKAMTNLGNILKSRDLWVFPVHQAGALVSRIQTGLVICFTLDNIHVSMLFSQNIPPSPSPTESKSLFCTSVSLFSVLHRGLSLPSF